MKVEVVEESTCAGGEEGAVQKRREKDNIMNILIRDLDLALILETESTNHTIMNQPESIRQVLSIVLESVNINIGDLEVHQNHRITRTLVVQRMIDLIKKSR